MFYAIASFCTYKETGQVDEDGGQILKVAKPPLIASFLDGMTGIVLLIIGGLAASGCCF